MPSEETIVLEKFLKEGFKDIPAKIGSNNGIDILLVDSKDITKLTKMIIIEVKSYSAANKIVPTTSTMGDGYGFKQMTDDWIEALYPKLKAHIEVAKQASGTLLEEVYTNHRNKIEKYVIQIDKTGNAAIIKVN